MNSNLRNYKELLEILNIDVITRSRLKDGEFAVAYIAAYDESIILDDNDGLGWQTEEGALEGFFHRHNNTEKAIIIDNWISKSTDFQRKLRNKRLEKLGLVLQVDDIAEVRKGTRCPVDVVDLYCYITFDAVLDEVMKERIRYYDN